jgi:hypothetical protein
MKTTSENSNERNLVQYKENAINTVMKAFCGIQEELQHKILTVMGVHAIPETLLNKDNQKVSLQEWIEKEAVELKSPENFEYFTKVMQMAISSLNEGRAKFLPQKKPIEGRHLVPNASAVVRLIENGFFDIKDVEKLFKFSQLDLNKNIDDFLVDRRSGKVGHERYTACRLLKRAFAISALEKYMKEVGQWMQYSFGMAECPDPRNIKNAVELGLFAGSTPPKQLFTEEEERQKSGDFHRWELVDDILIAPKFIIFDTTETGGHLVEGIKFIEFSFKDANEAIRKMERKGEVTPDEANDLGRMRIVLKIRDSESDEMLLERKLRILQQLDRAASMRSNFDVEVETRTINGLPNFSDDSDENFEEQKQYTDDYGFSNFRHKRTSGELSGEKYKNFSQKIIYRDPQNKESLFAFELQLMDENEYKTNENPKTTAAYFPRKIEAIGGLELPRTDSIMTKKQYLEHLEAWLRNHYERHPEKISEAWKLIDAKWADGMKKGGLPQKIEGVHKFHLGWKSTPDIGKWRTDEKHFTFDFASGDGKVDDKKFQEMAEIAFEFLFASGQIRKVPQTFPKKLTASKIELENSPYFLGADAYRRIANLIPNAHLRPRN